MATIKTSPVPFNPDTYLAGDGAPDSAPALREALLAAGEVNAAALHCRIAASRPIKFDAEPHLNALQREREESLATANKPEPDGGFFGWIVLGIRIAVGIALVALMFID